MKISMKTVSAILFMALSVQASSSLAAAGDEFWDNRYAAVGGPGFGQRGVRTILVQGANVYVGGGFTQIAGVPANNIAKWDGTNWSALGGGLDGVVSALAAHGGDLYVGGSFESAGGIAATNVARWNGSGWSAVGPQAFPYPALAVAVSTNGNELYAGHGVM